MPPRINHLQPGAQIWVAWIDFNGECQADRVRVQEAYQTEDGLYVVDVCDSDKRFQLVQSPPDPCVAVDMADGSNDRHVIEAGDDIFGRPVFGIERSVGSLLWQIQLRVLEMGGAPRDAIDILALGFGLYPSSAYAALRRIEEDRLRARLDNTISGMVASAQARNPGHD